MITVFPLTYTTVNELYQVLGMHGYSAVLGDDVEPHLKRILLEMAARLPGPVLASHSSPSKPTN